MNHQILINTAEKYGTPLYFYDGDLIEARYHLLKSCFPEEFSLYYVMKANPLAGIAQILLKANSGIAVCSAGELAVALKAGFPPQSVLFSGPGKSKEELTCAIRSDIGCLSVESLSEILQIDKIGREEGRTVKIILRINPDAEPAGTAVSYAGKASQFGIDEGALPDLFRHIADLNAVKPAGIHIYSGTQVFKVDAILRNIETVLKLALKLAGDYGVPLHLINIGCGFGTAYTSRQKPLDTAELTAGFQKLRDTYLPKLRGTRVAVECGRFIMAEAGCFLVRILYRKQSKGREYLICDGGINFYNKTPYLGRFSRSDLPVELPGKEPGSRFFQVTGPLCTPQDLICQDANLSEPETGDILVVRNTGAYGFTESPALFLSHATPREVIVYKGREYVLRTQGRPEDFMNRQAGMNLCQNL